MENAELTKHFLITQNGWLTQDFPDIHRLVKLAVNEGFLTVIYDVEHDSRCERHTVFAVKCFRRHMLLEICSKCEILLKCCPKCEKVLKGAQNAK